MSTGSLIPAVAGLAVGIAFVIAFAFVVAGLSTNTGVFVPDTSGDELCGGNFGEQNKIELTIDGLRNTYRPGEHIIFSVSAKGTSDNACNIVSPSVDIRNDSDGKMMYWPHPFGLSYAMGCLKASLIDKVWTFGDNADKEIVLENSGPYTIVAPIEGVTVEKQFTVTS